MQRIDGTSLAATIREELKKEIRSKNLTPKLGVLLVGDDAASRLYVNLKEKAAHEAGIVTDIRRLPAQTPDEELKNVIEEWNKDETVDAILVQLPLPAGHDTDTLISLIDPRKDVDGFHPQTIADLYEGRANIIPPVHEGILRLIASTGIRINTARVAVIANSEIFSKPLEFLLRKAGAFVSVLSPDELDRKALLTANVIVTAVGRANLLDRAMIPAGAVVIDVGTTRLANEKTVGDVDAESVKDLDGWLTPVPGGVGPMTIAVLLKNVVTLAKARRGIS